MRKFKRDFHHKLRVVVFTNCLSITPAVGLASRPAASREAVTSV